LAAVGRVLRWPPQRRAQQVAPHGVEEVDPRVSPCAVGELIQQQREAAKGLAVTLDVTRNLNKTVLVSIPVIFEDRPAKLTNFQG
jgi:hypothetical protein